MSDMNVSRLGQINATGSNTALFLRKFGGEVMVAFMQINKFMARTMVRTIENGESAQFPATGVATASYHVPGTEILGQKINHGQRIISIDSLLIADTFIANIDEAMNHYDVRSIYSGECGKALANAADGRLGRVLALAARASATVSGGRAGAVINSGATVTTNETVLISALTTGAQKLDENFAPEDGRYAALRAAQYYLLVNGTKAINKFWTSDNGGLDKGKVFYLEGLEIVKTQQVPSANASVVTGESNTYNGVFNTTVGLVWQKPAAGTVKLLDLSVETEYSVRHQGTLAVAKYAMGHGILRPEVAFEITSDA